MMGLGQSDNFINRVVANPKRTILWALLAALFAHACVLSMLGLPSAVSLQSTNSFIAVQLDNPIAREPESAPITTPPKRDPEPELPIPSQTGAQLPDQDIPQPISPVTIIKPKTATTETTPKNNTAVSINSSAFKTFIANETQRAIAKNKQQLKTFEESFIAPEEAPKAEFDRGTPTMGGGNYKVSRNGQTCETLVMVPQSFDDFSNGTLTTSGMCKPNKKRFNLTNKDGSIRNSDRLD